MELHHTNIRQGGNVKIFAGDLKGLSDALGEIVKTIPLELDAAHKLILIADKAVRGFQVFEGQRIPLLNKYCKKDKDGKTVTTNGEPDGPADFEEGDEAKFSKKYAELASKEIEFDFEPISFDLLKLRADGDPYLDDDGKPIRILPQLLGGLLPIIKTTSGDG